MGEPWHGIVLVKVQNDHLRIAHVIIRLFGALIVAQGVVVLFVRKCQDGELRRGIVKAYFVAFALMAIVLIWSQMTDRYWRMSNWMNIILFSALASFYGWFSFFQPPPVFDGLDRVTD